MTAVAVRLIALALTPLASDLSDEGRRPVRITVVSVLANSKSTKVAPSLKPLACMVHKREPELTGFRVVSTRQKSIPVGKDHIFELPDKQTLKVQIDRPKGKDGRVGLTIRPPGLGEISYNCSCSKYFPVVTPHVTPSGERLIVVVMAKPCNGK